MIYIIGYFVAVLIVGLLLARRVHRPAGIVLWSLVISIAGCAIYQSINYVINGLDPFIELAIGVQLVGGFIVSAIAGVLGFRRRAQKG